MRITYQYSFVHFDTINEKNVNPNTEWPLTFYHGKINGWFVAYYSGFIGRADDDDPYEIISIYNTRSITGKNPISQYTGSHGIHGYKKLKNNRYV